LQPEKKDILMNKTEDKPIILTKRKNIQTVLDYCLEQKISFSANPRAISIDEWELELEITTIKSAIALGIFVKENKLELYGIGTTTEVSKPKAATPIANNKKAEPKESIPAPSLIDELVLAPVVEENAISNATLSFDLNNSNN
jgi:hypothetical protein